MQVTLTFHDKLVRPRNQSETVIVIECLTNILAKRVPRTTR